MPWKLPRIYHLENYLWFSNIKEVWISDAVGHGHAKHVVDSVSTLQAARCRLTM